MVECDFPELNSFGTVIRFALELEKVAAAVNEQLANDPKMASASETFREIAANHKKREILLVNTRREKLNEMILEPIQDLEREHYIVDPNIPAGADLKTSASFAAGIESTSARFYGDSSKVAKNLLSEAARIMEKMAKENLANKSKLEAL